MAFFFFFCVLEHVFRIFIPGRAALLLSLLPTFLFTFVLKEIPAFQAALLALFFAAALRVFSILIPGIKKIFLFMALTMDIAVLYIFLALHRVPGESAEEKLLCICLTILTMCAIQALFFEKDRVPFPIYYFLAVGILVSVIPMKEAPIDWTPVIEMGQKIAAGIEKRADDMSYLFASLFGESYTAGYSTLAPSGQKLDTDEKMQLILTTDELPYRTYEEEGGSTMKLRRTLYLAGGRGADLTQFVRFVSFLYSEDIDGETAGLFTGISHVNVEYGYLDTRDVIAPSNAILLNEWGGRVTDGVSSVLHKKGYSLEASYLDIDYGSPVLVALMEDERGVGNEAIALIPDYDTASSYVKSLWEIELKDIISSDEFERAVAEILSADMGSGEYLDAAGASPRLTELSDELASGVASDYEKCSKIEAYLRQYTYSRDAVGGYDPDSDMSTPEGMSDIAERFLFDTGKGYCVHYTSSMVMLLRLCGIPARAVSGFRYAFPFEKAGEYTVSSSCAHIWPEAYISGIGWVPFEPTSAYYTISGNHWHRTAAGEKEALPGASKSTLPVPAPVSDDALDEEPADSTVSTLFTRFFIPAAVTAAVLMMLIVLAIRLAGRLRYKFGTPEYRLGSDVEQIKKLLIKKSGGAVTDLGLLSDFTPAAPSELQEDLNTVFSAYYRSVYGTAASSAPTPTESALAKTLREKLR